MENTVKIQPKLEKNRSLNYVTPKVINYFLYFYFILLPFFAVENKQGYWYALIIATFGLFMFNLGYKIKTRSFILLKNSFRNTLIKKITLIIFISYDLFSIASLLLQGISQNSYNLDFLGRGGSVSLYFLIIEKTIYFIKYYIYSYYIGISKKNYWGIFIVTVLATLNSRQRFDMVSSSVFFIIYGVFNNYLALSAPKIIVSLLLFPIFTLATLMKRDFVGSASLNLVMTEIKETIELYLHNNVLIDSLKMSMESFATFEIYNNVIRDRLIIPNHGMLRFFFNFIPRSIWSDKPLPSQNVLAMLYVPEAFISGGGVFANLFGDAYINGGLLAVMVILFVLGKLSKELFLNAKLVTNAHSQNIGLYSLFVPFLLSFYRGQLSDMFWQFLLFITIFKMLNFLDRHTIKIK